MDGRIHTRPHGLAHGLEDVPNRQANRRNLPGSTEGGRLVPSVGSGSTRAKDYLLIRKKPWKDRLRDDPRYQAFDSATHGKRWRSVCERLLNGDSDLARRCSAAVAMHKDGPVPVFRTGVFHETTWRGESLEVEVVVNRVRGGFVSTAEALWADPEKSLLGAFDDLALEFCDVLWKDPSAFNESKLWIESSLRRSVLNRLETMVPSTADWRAFEKNRLFKGPRRKLCRLYEEHWDTAILAEYGGWLVRLFLQETLKCLGLRYFRRDEYDVLPLLREKWNEKHGSEAVRDLFAENDALSFLAETVTVYGRGGSPEDARFEGLPWVQDFAGYLRFLADIRPLSHEPHRPRVFYSRLAHARKADYVKDQLVRRFTAHIGDAEVENEAAIWEVGDRGGVRFRREIVAKIWLGDAFVVYFTDLTATPEKSYEWLVREMDYALTLGKKIYIYLEKGVDPSDVHHALAALTDPLIPEARTGNRAALLADAFLQTSYLWTNPDDKGFELGLPELHDEIRRRRHDALFEAFLHQFSAAERRILKLLTQTDCQAAPGLPDLLRKTYPDAFDGPEAAEAALRSLWVSARELTVCLPQPSSEPAEQLALVAGTETGILSQFAAMLGAVRPDLDDSEIMDWQLRLLRLC